MGSSRLSGKVLKTLGEKSVLQHVFDRLEKCKNVTKSVLATTDSKGDDVLEEWAHDHGIEVFRGSEFDVLQRYYDTAKYFNADIVVRVTSDCPFIDYEILDDIVSLHIAKGSDYTSNVHPPTFPDGLDVEVFSFEALEQANKFGKDPKQREHVTPYIWDKINNFKCINYANKEDYSNIRVTLDTLDDYNFLKKIEAGIKVKNFKLNELIEFVNNNRDLLLLNQHHIRNENF